MDGRLISHPHNTQLSPKGDLVLAKVATTEEKTTGGILLPDSAQRKPTSGTTKQHPDALCANHHYKVVTEHLTLLTGDIVELGDGRVGTAERPFTLKVGDTVVYSKFGMGITEVDIQGTTYALMREDDVIGIMPSSSATAADVPKIKPLGDRVLLKVCFLRWCCGVHGGDGMYATMWCRCTHGVVFPSCH